MTISNILLGAVLNRGFILTGAVAAALSLQAQQTPSPKPQAHTSGKGDTASCLKEVAQMNMGVIKIAQLGSSKAQNSELKKFTQQLVTDHKHAQDRLEKIAKTHGVTLPTSLDPKCQEELTKLQGKSGTEFDKEFAKGAVQGHATAVAKLEEASAGVRDADLKAYVKDMLAQVKMHQEEAREVAKTVGLDQATIASLETVPPEGVGTAGSSTQTDRGTGTPETTQPRPRNESAPQP